jgi:thiol:disulfide interchange protein DsbD
MNGFRKAMAVPLYLTVVWLIWILARQAGPDAVAMALAGFVALGVGLSLWQHAHWLARTTRLLALGAALALAGKPAILGASAITPTTAEHEAWSAQRLSQLRQEGHIVFVNFTADWCLTCKVNEKVALEDRRVRDAFGRHGVTWLTADWTRPDPAITEELAHWGRDGVPLYILYRPGRSAEVLPQILTPEQLLERLGEQTS